MGTETSSFLSHDKTHFLYIVKKKIPLMGTETTAYVPPVVIPQLVWLKK